VSGHFFRLILFSSIFAIDLVIAPHPDDETLAIGGFISPQTAKGAPICVVAVTDGEKALRIVLI
jgi:hypothetical protein